VNEVIDGKEITKLQKFIWGIPVAEHIRDFAVKLARNSRAGEPDPPEFVKKWVNWGAGPRASQYLVLAAKTRAALQGRYTPTIEDIEFVATPVLQHRILLNFAAEAENVATQDIIQKLIQYVKTGEKAKI
jgi:MoxR-like ATPase